MPVALQQTQTNLLTITLKHIKTIWQDFQIDHIM
jgi:hypothetical protein